MDSKITSCLSLMRRMPPNKTEKVVNGLLNILPESAEELLQRIDQPLELRLDSITGLHFLLCDYNRDGDSYRSPWSNAYFPPLEDGFTPSERLRALEIEANELFSAYRDLYYEGGLSSVYFWDLNHGGFAGCFLIKKSASGSKAVKDGQWDSIHVIEVQEDHSKRRASYKLTTTLLINTEVQNESVGSAFLGGTLTRQTEATSAVDETKTHIANMGRMIEHMETEIRSNLGNVYMMKTRDIVNSIRSVEGKDDGRVAFDKKVVASLGDAVVNRAAAGNRNSQRGYDDP